MKATVHPYLGNAGLFPAHGDRLNFGITPDMRHMAGKEIYVRPHSYCPGGFCGMGFSWLREWLVFESDNGQLDLFQ